MPEAVSIHNWIYFNVEADFEKSFQTLLAALDTDLEYIKTHTRLLVKALEWSTYNQDASYLLHRLRTGTGQNVAEECRQEQRQASCPS